MCESSVYFRSGEDERLVLEDVVLIRPTPGAIYIEDILGRSQEVPGRIELIDLMNHRVVICGE
jgi:predicted RNA-binding protein